MRPIPPLNPLHVFECAARHGSFTKAAEELGVTQPAVSRQVALLEDYLGVRLFHRETRGLTLTGEGKRYASQIAPAFRCIAEATDELVSARAAAPLKLQVYATFMAKWLMRRLPQLQTNHPDLRLRTRTAVTPVDFARDNVDAAIQLGTGDWQGMDSVFLFADEILPVCSPALLAGGPPVKTSADLLRYPLLHSPLPAAGLARLAGSRRRGDGGHAGTADVPQFVADLPGRPGRAWHRHGPTRHAGRRNCAAAVWSARSTGRCAAISAITSWCRPTTRTAPASRRCATGCWSR